MGVQPKDPNAPDNFATPEHVRDYAENTYRTAEGNIVPVPKRNRRGRKSNRKSSHPLRELRLQRGLTLEELSELSKLSPSYLSRLESGSRRLNVDTIERLSTALACEPSELLTAARAAGSWAPQAWMGGPSPYSAPSHAAYPSATPAQSQLPVYGNTPGSPIDFSAPISMITSPPELMGVPGAFALVVCDDRMSPRYHQGDRVLIHPGRPLTPRSTAVVVTKANQAIIGEFIAWHPISEINPQLAAVNDVHPDDDQQVLELKQYQNEDPENLGRRAEDAPLGQVLLLPSQISSVSRVVGMIES